MFFYQLKMNGIGKYKLQITNTDDAYTRES